MIPREFAESGFASLGIIRSLADLISDWSLRSSPDKIPSRIVWDVDVNEPIDRYFAGGVLETFGEKGAEGRWD